MRGCCLAILVSVMTIVVPRAMQYVANLLDDRGNSKDVSNCLHGRRSMGGQGDMSPLLFEVEGKPCVLSPPCLLEVDIVCYLKNSLFQQ